MSNALAGLLCLENVSLRGNFLVKLPDGLSRLRRLSHLDVRDNSMLSLAFDVADPKSAATLVESVFPPSFFSYI